jgi:hypothetical protein
MPFVGSAERLRRSHLATTFPDRPHEPYPEKGSDRNSWNDWVVERPATTTCSDRGQPKPVEPIEQLSSAFPNYGRAPSRAQSVPNTSWNPRDQSKWYTIMQRKEPLLSVNDQTFKKPQDESSIKIRLAAPIASWMGPAGQGEYPEMPPMEWFPRTDPQIYPKYLNTNFSESQLRLKDRYRFKDQLDASRKEAAKAPGTTQNFYPTRSAPDFKRTMLPLGDPIMTAPTRAVTGKPIPDPYQASFPAGARIPRASGTIYDGRPRLL